MERILVIEDELPMRTALQDVLRAENYRVLTASDGESGLRRALEEKPDLVLLDVMMPRLDGYTVCGELRRVGNPVPILMLTAKGQVEDRVTGLDAGADDYLVKPFSTEELLARVRALLRRTRRQTRAPERLRFGEVEVDLVQQTAVSGGNPVHLTAKEFAMLRLMAETPGEPVSRERFLDVVWGYTAFPTTRTVDNHIASLRSKLEGDAENPRWIKTVHGVGYKMESGENNSANTNERPDSMNRSGKTIACTLAALFAASAVCAAAPRMDRSKLLIGAYCLQENARTEAHVKAIRDCSVDFIVGVGAGDRATLDLFAKHGVGAIVNGAVPGWWGGDGENAGKLREKNPPEVYSKGAAALQYHPAIWAVDIGDEPSALDFPYYGEVVRQLSRELPGVPLYLNLYPNYASVAQNTGQQTVNQLGTTTYAEHVAEYCRHVPLDYISYDFYPYVEPAGLDRFLSKCYDNFIVVADACRRTGRGFWYIPQVNSREGQPPTSENRLRFQACAAMSFGAETITWACWSKGWWTNNVLDAAGVPTAQYAKLKKVNAELKRLGPEYMKFRSTATHFVGFPGGSSRNPKEPVSFPGALDAGFFKGVRASNGAPLLVGEMSARDPAFTARALFVTAADNPEDAKPASFEVIFRAPDPKAYGGDGPVPVRILPDGSCSVPLRSCHGFLLVSGE